ncbi:LysR family transcriptional regulator [uncultured Agrococcus sp.]|uniref:LysR family transcriptional regulator n=1 Tax=uncultured Agrococcus sp. TaxID=382258 RepID=UPI0025E4AAF3|nr:LysR family transcriptional regulator [uncultured Agrococcus sp.]
MMLNPIHLRTLIEVVGLGSFARAANRLGYTASAVSQQMNSLEQSVGITLFERTARSAHPTAAAKAMAKAAVPVFSDLAEIVETARRTAENVNEELAVGLYSSFSRSVIPTVLADEAFKATGIRLRVVVQNPSTSVGRFAAGDAADVSFVYRYGAADLAWPSSAKELLLGSDPYRLAVPRSWGIEDDEPLTAERLSAWDWAAMHPGSSDAIAIENAFRACNVHPHVSVRGNEFEVLLDFVAAGAAATFLPASVLLASASEVQIIDVPELSLTRTVHALIAPGAVQATVAPFLGAVRRALMPAGITPA